MNTTANDKTMAMSILQQKNVTKKWILFPDYDCARFVESDTLRELRFHDCNDGLERVGNGQYRMKGNRRAIYIFDTSKISQIELQKMINGHIQESLTELGEIIEGQQYRDRYSQAVLVREDGMYVGLDDHEVYFECSNGHRHNCRIMERKI